MGSVPFQTVERNIHFRIICHCTVIDRQRVSRNLGETNISVQIQSANTKYRLSHIFYSSSTEPYLMIFSITRVQKIKYFPTHDEQKKTPIHPLVCLFLINAHSCTKWSLYG